MRIPKSAMGKAMEEIVITLMAGLWLTIHLSRLSKQPRFTAAIGSGMTLSIALVFAGNYMVALVMSMLTAGIFYLSAATLLEWQKANAQQSSEEDG